MSPTRTPRAEVIVAWRMSAPLQRSSLNRFMTLLTILESKGLLSTNIAVSVNRPSDGSRWADNPAPTPPGPFAGLGGVHWPFFPIRAGREREPTAR